MAQPTAATKQDLEPMESAIGLINKHLTAIDYRLMTLFKCYDRISGLLQQLVDAQEIVEEKIPAETAAARSK